ncbi:hypothetical protein M422DRAFT_248140 [Sphaerobolus stellatus SS14]|uniref:Amino acid permease/ SLC12A domain-containing protein n=1 Tax=Sphaerobolus stellatus (strain SS14) TaxID=990650 RepID=A0A0C9UWE6_SPHS4|nr:hypothetical protein M422DRAFT_248140 [Sphaerobolus stellatus SS14]
MSPKTSAPPNDNLMLPTSSSSPVSSFTYPPSPSPACEQKRGTSKEEDEKARAEIYTTEASREDNGTEYGGRGKQVDEEGHLQRHLKTRHVQMISIGGVIGTGLFLGTARSLSEGGPLGLLLGYTVMSSVCIGVMICLGELVTYLPVPGGQVTLAGRFVDPALSFALGWNYWYCFAITLPGELSAASVIVSYWNKTINSGVWITIFLLVVVVINFLGTRSFGECEFWFASIKVATIVGLIILGLVIDLGGAPNHDRLGFRYWRTPGPFVQFAGIGGAKGQFLGFWSVLIQAAYAFIGTEILGMTAAETQNPRRNLPRAIRTVYWRISLFYIVGVFILGLICPSNAPSLTSGLGTAASSAWVIAIKMATIKALPSIINAALLTSAWSAGSSDLYTSSRALYGLAVNGHAPRFLRIVDRRGTPYPSLIVCSVFGALAYTGVSAGSSRTFNYFSNMSSVAGIINWMGICIAALRFRRGLKAQGFGLEILPYKSPLMPYIGWWSLSWILVIIIFAKWDVFIKGRWDTGSFISTYLPIPFFVVMFVGYKFWKKTKVVSLKEMDLVSGVSDA